MMFFTKIGNKIGNKIARFFAAIDLILERFFFYFRVSRKEKGKLIYLWNYQKIGLVLFLIIGLPTIFILLSQEGGNQQQSQQQQTSQHFSTGTLNLADTSINLSASAAPLTFTHTHTADTRADFEGSGVNIHKGFNYRATESNLIRSSAQNGEIASTEKGLVGLWHMNDDNWQDASGKGNHGTAFPTASPPTFTTSSKLGSHAGSFDGTDDYVKISGFGNSMPTSEITIEAWVKPNLATAQDDLFSLEPLEPVAGSRVLVHFPWDSTIHWQFGSPFQIVSVALDPNWVGIWNHFAFVASYSGNYMKIYRNGVEVATKVGMASFVQATADFHIGGRSAATFSGSIDEFAIYSRALTVEEIKQHYEAGSPVEATLYRSPRFDLGVKTKLSSANLIKNVSAGTDMKVYLRSGNTLGVDTDNIDEGVLRDTSKAEFDAGTKENINTTIQGEMNAEGTLGLVGLWHMNDDNWQDAKGTNQGTCTAPSCPTFTTSSKLGSHAGSFDGGDDYVTFPSPVTPLGAKTLEAWVRTTSTKEHHYIMTNGICGTASHGFGLQLYNGQPGFMSMHGVSGAHRFAISSPTAINDGLWHHIVGTWDGTTNTDGVKLYVDKDLKATGTAATTETVSPSYNFMFGQSPECLAYPYYLSGFLDESAVYNRALSPAEILDHYNAGAGKELFPPVPLSTYISSPINLDTSYDLDVIALQTDIPSGTSLTVAVRSATTTAELSTAAWTTAPALETGTTKINILSVPQGTVKHQFWQYKIEGATDGNRTWVVRDVFLIPQPSGYSRLKRIDNNLSEVQNVGDNRYFQYLVLGASNGSAVWELDKIDLFSRFSAFDLGKRYQIAEVSLTDSDNSFYRIHYSLENTDNYLSVTAWQDVGDKTAANTLTHTFPAPGQALRWMRFNQLAITGSPPAFPVAIAFLAKEANVYTIKKGDGTSLTRNEPGTISAYYGLTLPSAAIGKISEEIQTYQICAGNVGDLRRITIKALPHPEGTDGYKCASLSWNNTDWIDASEGPGERATITPDTPGYIPDPNYGTNVLLPKNTGCKNFYLRTKVPSTNVAEGPKKIRFYFEGEVL